MTEPSEIVPIGCMDEVPIAVRARAAQAGQRTVEFVTIPGPEKGYGGTFSRRIFDGLDTFEPAAEPEVPEPEITTMSRLPYTEAYLDTVFTSDQARTIV